jgi:hypothetical protein
MGSAKRRSRRFGPSYCNIPKLTGPRLYEELDDLPIPYEFSLVLSDKVTDPEVVAHIQRVGIVFYEKQE